MQFMKKIPGENKKRTKELLSSGWNRLKEPSNLGIAILYSLPISIELETKPGYEIYFTGTTKENESYLKVLSIRTVL